MHLKNRFCVFSDILVWIHLIFHHLWQVTMGVSWGSVPGSTSPSGFFVLRSPGVQNLMPVLVLTNPRTHSDLLLNGGHDIFRHHRVRKCAKMIFEMGSRSLWNRILRDGNPDTVILDINWCQVGPKDYVRKTGVCGHCFDRYPSRIYIA